MLSRRHGCHALNINGTSCDENMTEYSVISCYLGLVVLELVAMAQNLKDEGIDMVSDEAMASRNTVIHIGEDFTLAIS